MGRQRNALCDNAIDGDRPPSSTLAGRHFSTGKPMPYLEFPRTFLVVAALAIVACSTGADPAEDDEPVEAPPTALDEFEEFQEEASDHFANRGDDNAARRAIELWTQALQVDDDGTITDNHRAAALEAISQAHHYLAYYHERPAVDADIDEASAAAGLQAAEEALRIRAPEVAAELRRSDTLEIDLTDVSEDAAPALLWYAKNRFLLTRAQSLSAAVEAEAIIDAMMEFVADHRPALYHGEAHRYFGQRWIDRPFHRSPQRSDQAFERSLEIAPDFLATRVLRARHLAVFHGDRQSFERDLNAVLDSTAGDAAHSAEDAAAQRWAADLLDRSDQFFD